MSLEGVSKSLDLLVLFVSTVCLPTKRSVSCLSCGRFTLERRIDSGFAVLIIVHLVLDTALLAALHELLEGGLPPTAALEQLLGLRHCQVPVCEEREHTR